MNRQKSTISEPRLNISVPWRSIWSTLGLITLFLFGWFQAVGYLVPGFKEISSFQDETATINDAGLMWVPVISYLLISTVVCVAVNIFKPLKKFGDKGLIEGLVRGLAVGFSVGFAVGFFAIIDEGLIEGLVRGLAVGFSVGFSVSILFYLIEGLAREFMKEKGD